MRKQVALIGVYPPPIGGISIHIERLSDYLDDLGIAHTIYDNTAGDKRKPVHYVHSIERWAFAYWFTAKEDIIHCHFLRWQVRFALALLKLRGKRIVFTFHSFRQEEATGWLKQKMIHLVGKLGDAFLCVTETIAVDLIQAGIPAHKVQVVPAFIPPRKDIAASLPSTLERAIVDRLPLIVANGSIGVWFKQLDLYGADLCIELTRHLVPHYPQLKFVYAITVVADAAYMAELEQRVQAYGIADHFLFVQEKMELYPLMKHADLMVRTTSSDGDAISIREALHVGTPVVASDCCPRPHGVVTYRNRDIEDLVQEVMKLLARKERITVAQRNYADDVVAAYRLKLD